MCGPCARRIRAAHFDTSMGRTSDAKQKLLDAAIDLIWSASYASVGVDQICERAGVKKGSFYHFFPSKTELAIAAYDAFYAAKAPIYERVFAPEIPPLDRIAGWCRAVYETQLERYREAGHVCGCPFASIGDEMGGQDERLRKKMQEFLERATRYLEFALRDAHARGLVQIDDPAAKARSLQALMLGHMLQAKVMNDPEILRDTVTDAMELIGARRVER